MKRLANDTMIHGMHFDNSQRARGLVAVPAHKGLASTSAGREFGSCTVLAGVLQEDSWHAPTSEAACFETATP